MGKKSKLAYRFRKCLLFFAGKLECESELHTVQIYLFAYFVTFLEHLHIQYI